MGSKNETSNKEKNWSLFKHLETKKIPKLCEKNMNNLNVSESKNHDNKAEKKLFIQKLVTVNGNTCLVANIGNKDKQVNILILG